MSPLSKFNSRANSGRSGAALVIVLSIVALLSVVVVAFLGSSTKEVDISQKSSSTIQSGELFEQATAQVVGDFLKEVRAGSVEVSPFGDKTKEVTILYPATPESMVPDRSTAGAGLDEVTHPNIVKQSRYAQKFYNPAKLFDSQLVYPKAAENANAPTSRASPVSTTPPAGSFSASLASSQGITPARWNLPGLLTRANRSSSTDMTPADNGTSRLKGGDVPWTWKSPDWVYLQKDGRNPVSWTSSDNGNPQNAVLGRYAFQVYDVGGLLDLNVAGYDPDSSVVGDDVAARKGGVAFADLTQIGLKDSQLKKLLAYRNPGVQGDAVPPSIAGLGPGKLPYGSPYANFVLGGNNSLGFLRVGAFGNNPLNRFFPSRMAMITAVQQLVSVERDRPAALDALQYLTHYSRGLEQPSYKPGFYRPSATGASSDSPVFARPSIVPPAEKVDDKTRRIDVVRLGGGWDAIDPNDFRVVNKLPLEIGIANNRGGNDAWGTLKDRAGGSDERALQDVINPGFLEVRVKKEFTRMDGTKAILGEPLVKKRFPLERLAWVTWKGPSATLQTTDESYNKDGTAENIFKAFGLRWDRDQSNSTSEVKYFWRYEHDRPGFILKLEDLAEARFGDPREPDFFELLKAGIAVGSLGKSAMAMHNPGDSWDSATYHHMRDRNTSFQVLEIGANLIDQSDTNSFPTIIKMPNPDPNLGSGDRYNPPLFTARGVEDLPYFYRFHWRGIEDTKDKPNIPFTKGGGPEEIDSALGVSLAKFQLGAYRCGTTLIMGFPELWNPHSVQAGPGFDAAKLPEDFRIVAASETPSDVVDPPGSTLKYDKGLSNLPKLGNVQGVDSSNQSWISLANAYDTEWNYDAQPNPSAATFNRGNFRAGDFLLRPTGYFAFGIGNAGYTFLKLNPGNNSQGSSLRGSGNGPPGTMIYNWYSQVWNWPFEYGSDGLDPVASIFFSDRSYEPGPRVFNGSPSSLGIAPVDFGKPRRSYPPGTAVSPGLLSSLVSPWPRGYIPQFGEPMTPSLTPTIDAETYKRGSVIGFNVLCMAPLWRLPALDFSNPDAALSMAYPQFKSPVGWPSGTKFFTDAWRTRRYVLRPAPAAIDVTAAKKNPSAALHVDGSMNYYVFDAWLNEQLAVLNGSSNGTALVPAYVPSGGYMSLKYPLTPDTDQTFLAQSYAAGMQQGGLTYSDGTPLPAPFPVYRPYAFALTDKPNVQRSIIQTLPGPASAKKPEGSEPGTAQNNRTVDIRGTELLFKVGSKDVFREPTTLCQAGLPKGSSYAAGKDNFFMGSGYGGFVPDGDTKWLGFAMGEVPSTYIAATKITRRQQYVDVADVIFPSKGDKLVGDGNSPPVDLAMNRLGYTFPENYPATKYGSLPVLPQKMRFFYVPVNVAGLNDTRFTVRLQYKDPIQKQWVTYDERFIQIDSSDWNGARLGASPVVGSKDLTPVFEEDSSGQLSGQISWKVNGKSRPIGWSYPVVTSYDPRTPRFGHPLRYGYDDPKTIRDASSQVKLFLNPLDEDPGNGRAPEFSMLYPNGGNKTDRPTSLALDLSGVGGPAGVLSARYFAPASFFKWVAESGSGVFPANYTLACGKRPPATIGEHADWWACGKEGGKLVLQGPTFNAYDYGWYPHGFKLTNGTTPKNAYKAGAGNKPTLLDNANFANLPNFIQDPQGGRYVAALRPGNLSENIAPSQNSGDSVADQSRQAYADPDDVVRRASGGLASQNGYTNAIEGLPMGQAVGANTPYAAGSRPIVLNRPFRSVAEMGYTFRGAPWKNISFFLPETGDAALLDLFCIAEPPPMASPGGTAEPPLVAGKVNLNTRQEPVLLAMVSGALKDELNPAQRLTGAASGEAGKVAQKLLDRTTGSKVWQGPLTNVSDLAGKIFGKDLSSSSLSGGDSVYTSVAYASKAYPDGGGSSTAPMRNLDVEASNPDVKWHFTSFAADLGPAFTATRDAKTQRFRESALRALVDGGQTRVWNLMVDLVVQTGKLTPNAKSLADFMRQGERRAWVFLSIDRLTGEVIDQQIEWVQ
jgi:hypothetical protein